MYSIYEFNIFNNDSRCNESYQHLMKTNIISDEYLKRL